MKKFDTQFVIKTIGSNLKYQLIGEHGDQYGHVSNPIIADAIQKLDNASYDWDNMLAAIKRAVVFVKDQDTKKAIDTAVRALQPII